MRYRLHDAGSQDGNVLDVFLQPVRLCGCREGLLCVEVGDGVVRLTQGRGLHFAVPADDWDGIGVRVRHLMLPSGSGGS